MHPCRIIIHSVAFEKLHFSYVHKVNFHSCMWNLVVHGLHTYKSFVLPPNLSLVPTSSPSTAGPLSA